MFSNRVDLRCVRNSCATAKGERVGRQADAESFVEEMEAHSADAVVVAGLLTRLPRPAALLGALARLLRPGGVVVVETDYGWAPALTAPSRQLAAPGAGRVLPTAAPALINKLPSRRGFKLDSSYRPTL